MLDLLAFSRTRGKRSNGRLLLVTIILVLIAACGGESAPLPTVAVPAQPDNSATAPETERSEATPEPGIRRLTVLYTNDEHGWIEGMNDGQGAAELVDVWRREHGYTADGPFLVLSGGDLWTGPAISTWFEGDSTTEVLNAMGYDAAAVGNHEFDFGLDVLRARAFEAHFPLLSANIRNRDDGRVPEEYGIQPYVVVTVNGIRVGLVGLTTRSTPRSTNPINVRTFDFIDYETALREVVPQARDAGAEMILVPAHICRDEALTLAQAVRDLDIQLIGGGHCNELFSTKVGDIVVLEGGFHFTSYAYADFEFDTGADVVVAVTHGTGRNSGGAAVRDVDAVVNRWRERAEEELELVIGYSERGIARRSPEMLDLVTYSWLAAFPNADVALTNLGGFRAALPAGDITLGDVIGMLPFNNVIVEVTVNGSQLEQVLNHADNAVAGARRAGGRWVLDDGSRLDPNATYVLLVNDFMFAGGDGYDMLERYDPAGYNTAVDWRQPVIDWVRAQESGRGRPLDAALEAISNN